MKAVGGPQKLRYTVISFSGEDPDYPVRELLHHNPQTRGWQTPRFAQWPQEVVLKLEHPSKIQQIQMLSHEYKIASKVEVFVACPKPGEETSKAPFSRLGYLSFDSNERSNYQARELKTVHVNTQAYFVRLVVHRCHMNKLNLYSQAGIIALNLIGEPIRPGVEVPPGGLLQLHPVPTREVAYYNQAAADVADLNIDLHVDTITAQKIRELARAKDLAVANEDYDEAKRLKASIDRLKVVGQKIAQLEARKRAAVEKEDYDTAKLIKADIDKLRSAGDTAAISSETYAPRPNNNPDDILNRVLKSKGPVVPVDEMPVRGMQQSGSAGGAAVDGEAAEQPPMLEQEASAAGIGQDLQAEPSYGDRGSMGGGHSRHIAYDERPAQGRGRYTPSDDPGIGAIPAAPTGPAESDIPAPHGWPADLPPPEPLTGATAKDAEALEEVAGEYCARAFHSRTWQLREAALNYLIAQLNDLTGKPGAFRTLINCVRKGLKDKVANVVTASFAAFQAFIDGFAGSGAGKHDIHGACDSVLPLLLEKLGDSNPRLSSAAKDSIMYLAGVAEANLKGSTHILVKPIKNQNAWKPVLGILTILQELVPLFGMSKSGDGFELQELMEFVSKAYNSANADVRSAAIKVTREVHDIVGQAIRRFLPKDINPKVKEQLDALLGDAPAGAAPPSMASAAARGPSTRAPATAASRAAPAAAAAPAAGRGKAARGKAAAAPQPAAYAPPPQPPPVPQPVAPDDPRPFEEELKERERRLGGDHPDVAESCSNLAILYNQKGLTDKAQPLYERALAIYEKVYGPDHPEVAHTLTDLAVLHLEAGRDAVGRPLLERALVIQEKALGPDHPDVIAIKDVLNSE